MPCVNLRNNWLHKTSLSQAEVLPRQQIPEQEPAVLATPTTRVARTTSLKDELKQKRAELAAKRVIKRAAKASQKAQKAQKFQKFQNSQKTPKPQDAQRAQKAQSPAAKLTPAENIPGIISSKPAKPHTLPSNVFRHQNHTKPTRADLINAESRLGSQLFGAIPAGHRREFFHDQKNIWIWHEDWIDAAEHEHEMTIRYEVRTSGVYKKVSAGKYFKLEGDELENFRKATHAYLYIIKKYLYNHPYSKVVA